MTNFQPSDTWNDFLEGVKIEIEQVSNGIYHLFMHRKKFFRLDDELHQLLKNLTHYVSDCRTIGQHEFTHFQKLLEILINLNILINELSDNMFSRTIKQKGEDFLENIIDVILTFINEFNISSSALELPTLQIDEWMLRQRDDYEDLQLLYFYLQANKNPNKDLINRLKPKFEDPARSITSKEVVKAISAACPKAIMKKEQIDIQTNICLHHGSQYNVYYGILKDTQKIVSVEMYHPPAFTKEEFNVFIEKVKMMSFLDHFSIVKLVGVLPTEPFCIIREFMAKNSLDKILRGLNYKYNASKRTVIALGIAYAMRYLHSKNIIHSSLKASDVYIDACDFPRVLCGTSLKKLGTVVNILDANKDDIYPWTAPELIATSPYISASNSSSIPTINNIPKPPLPINLINNSNSQSSNLKVAISEGGNKSASTNKTSSTNSSTTAVNSSSAQNKKRKYKKGQVIVDQKVDVYSYGVLLWELLTKDTAYSGLSSTQIAHEVVNNDQRPLIPQNCPRNLSKLIQSCWHKDPLRRPDFAQICEMFENGEVSFPDSNFQTTQNFVHITSNMEKINYTSESVKELVEQFMNNGKIEDDELISKLLEILHEEEMDSSSSNSEYLDSYQNENSNVYLFNENSLLKLSWFLLSSKLKARMVASELFKFINENKIADSDTSMASIIPNLILSLNQSSNDKLTLNLLNLLIDMIVDNTSCCLTINKLDAPSTLIELFFSKECPEVVLAALSFITEYLVKFYAPNEFVALFLTHLVNINNLGFDFNKEHVGISMKIINDLYLMSKNDRLFTLMSVNQRAIEALVPFLESTTDGVVISCLRLLFTLVAESNYIFYSLKLFVKIAELMISENPPIHAISCAVLSKIVPLLDDLSFIPLNIIEYLGQNMTAHSLRFFGALSVTHNGAILNQKVLTYILDKMLTGNDEERELAGYVLESQSSQTPFNEVLINAIPIFFDKLDEGSNVQGCLLFLSNVALDPQGAKKCYENIDRLLSEMTAANTIAANAVIRTLLQYEVFPQFVTNVELIRSVINKTLDFWTSNLFDEMVKIYDVLSLSKAGRKTLYQYNIGDRIKKKIQTAELSPDTSALAKRIISRL
ncbi:hypothetical protein TRFO_32646 [Tritrichomonas foetus]|uniref:Protein kinase domain-containing protein n=1 Tax=Tritrichomonas foetus TaxID=1144522 RepID=A0A1J4JNC3_9EUKA|nr:hypothetical protein TRFO_32646 [Tritrichomonas foetus]|eukprot:OHT00625.1 hypothetical protein TRFO_32646 [Tritrichomonas foetus]